LLKKNAKVTEDYRDYNSAVSTRTVMDKIKYYYVADGKLAELKRDKKAIAAVFGEKGTSISTYIDANKIDLKNDDALVKVFQYAATLQ
jgi:hypothetical protein